jgi:hypothetical protein
MYKLIHLSAIALVLFLTGCKSNPVEVKKAEASPVEHQSSIVSSTPNNNSKPSTVQFNASAVIIILLTILLLLAVIVIIKNRNLIQNLEKNPTVKLHRESDSEYANQLISVKKLLSDFITEIRNKENKLQSEDKNTVSVSSTNEAVATLARDLSIREKETQKLFDIIIKSDQRKTFAAICSFRENLLYISKLCKENKMAEKESIEQIVIDIESLLLDLGLETLSIPKGTKVSALLPGSFNILSTENPDSPQLAGTVKESATDAIYIKDSNGKHLFISPAKIKVYKI